MFTRSDFSYNLPPELIAQNALPERTDSRLMHLDARGGIEHHRFADLPNLVHPGDCLVLNDSRVIPARLLGERAGGGAAEALLLDRVDGDLWRALVRPGRRIRPGAILRFGNGLLEARVEASGADGERLLRMHYSGSWDDVLNAAGILPLPPYIHRQPADPERYQTVYGKAPGSVAAPTAGLHFSDALLGRLSEAGVIVTRLTLHVGEGTFRPVQSESLEDHHMHEEHYILPEDCVRSINRCRAAGGQVVAVGTTTCRVLESVCGRYGRLQPEAGSTDLFILPGYPFRVVDRLLTNFHLPESTLLMLVSAFAGRDAIRRAYDEAILRRYRFYSFGDAMLIDRT